VSRRILVAGGAADRRSALAASLDAVFDVDVVTASGPFDALRRLPNADFGLILVLLPSEAGEAPGLDLVRFTSGHARHGRTPVAVVGGDAADVAAAQALGARAVADELGDEGVRALVRDVLGLG
jgi:DNA-binding NarL/FixJ family response regulator